MKSGLVNVAPWSVSLSSGSIIARLATPARTGNTLRIVRITSKGRRFGSAATK